jgi:prepilin-type N-terminal cleavage/methylation domain-containing protein
MSGRRGGFTLVELAIVILLIGILTGLGLPQARRAVAEADGTRVLNDVAIIQKAATQHLLEEGRFPSSAGWGERPADFDDSLAGDHGFAYKDMPYRWFGFDFGFPFLGSNHLGILMIDMRERPGIAEALRDEADEATFWSPSVMYFLFWG